MRILVAAPPKTGNVWIEQLLSSIYGLDWLHTAPPSTDAGFLEWARSEFPDNSIVHQHYRPSPRILAASEALDAKLVTTLRNPYDQFVSLYFYAQRFAGNFRHTLSPAAQMVGRPIDDPAVVEYLRTDFRVNLEIGAEWLDAGRSSIVRYEALLDSPEAELHGLADQLGPADAETVRRAIEEAKPDRMRTLSKHVHAHIRSATSGDWRNHLTDAHLDAMSEHADLIERLGYIVERPHRGTAVVPFGTRRRRARNRATTPFVIVSLGRTGPAQLRYLLDSHPDVRCYGELFDPEAAYYATSGLTDHHRYLAEFDPSSAGSVVGFELPWSSIRAYPQVLDLFHDRRRRVLRLRQANRLAQFVGALLPEYQSYRHRDPDTDPPRVRVDLDECFGYLHDGFVTDRILDELLRHCRTLDVEYDDLDAAATHAAVQRFLGVKPAPLSSPLRRPPPRPLHEVVENWDEVTAALRGTVWERFLDAPVDEHVTG